MLMCNVLIYLAMAGTPTAHVNGDLLVGLCMIWQLCFLLVKMFYSKGINNRDFNFSIL